MKFNDIPQLTRSANYQTHVEWSFLEAHLDHWFDRGGNGEIAKLDLEPDFQRLHVWTPDQQTKYVEYILQGGMSGKNLYFNCNGWMRSWKGPFVIVDGKQRLHAVRQFLKNEVPIFNGKYFKDFEGRMPNHAHFICYVNDLKTRAEVIKWYLEMNTGGTPHTQSEIAKAQILLEECK
jgi:uncharacterized protein with ParB-like and HNH nuclease domain